MHAIATFLIALSWLCGQVIGSPVAAEVLLRSDSAEKDSSSEGKLFVPSLEEHEVHLKAIMGNAYTPEALAHDSDSNPQFTADYNFDEDEMEFLDDDEDYDDDDDFYFDGDDEDTFNGTALEARQAPCGQWSAVTRPAPEKRPRKDFHHKQLTQKIICGPGNGCGTSRTSSKTFSFGWDASVAAQWISAGFNVGKSYTTGNGYQCSAGAGGSVCLWKRVLHTSYRVRNGRFNSCTGFQATTSPFRMRSPNKSSPRTVFYCVRGSACRGIGDNYWQKGV